jgi:hypothetical protein
MNGLERFIMQIPHGTLRKVSYAWFGIVVFFVWPPIISGILALGLLFSFIILKAQRRIWGAEMRRRYLGRDVGPYVDRPKAPPAYQRINLLLMVLVSLVLAYLLDGKAGLSGVQWFLIAVGFSVLQLDLKLFGASTVYTVTDRGIGLERDDLRLFLRFDEIARVVPVKDVATPPERWCLFTPTSSIHDGVLLSPKNRAGFTRLIDQIFLAPTDQEQFLQHIPPRLVTDQV